MKNIKNFFITIIALIACAINACQDTPMVAPQDLSELIVIEEDDTAEIIPLVALQYLLQECFEKNDVQACKASLGLMTIMAIHRQKVSEDKLFEKKRKIKLQQETINKYGKIIDSMYAKKEKRRAKRGLLKKEAEQEVRDKRILGSSLLD